MSLPARRGGRMTEANNKIDVVKKFGSLFKTRDQEMKTIPESAYKVYLSPDNVLGVIPKTLWCKEALEKNFDVRESKCDQLLRKEYILKESDIGKVQESKYSHEYMKVIIDIVKEYENPVFRMKKDFPLSIETEDFIIVLAPRVE
jgi:hypothetical protein